MKIAILGATSQIAKDLICQWSLLNQKYELSLFARRIDVVGEFVQRLKWQRSIVIHHLDDFASSTENYDAIINFIGFGDPSRIANNLNVIMQVTHYYDEIVMCYLEKHQECRYLFLSSGAVYGNVFFEPVNEKTDSRISINNIMPHDFYSMAKLYAEVRHRVNNNYTIIDIRVFNIFSRNQDLDARFFITDIVRSIRDRTVLVVSPDTIVRDYLHPSDFQQLIDIFLLKDKHINMAVDCYSKSSIDKFELLDALVDRYGLHWKLDPDMPIVNATGSKKNYFTENKIAKKLGYVPHYSSLDTICTEIDALFNITG